MSITKYNVTSGILVQDGSPQTMNYDGAGNPSNYKGTNLYWEGKRLTGVGVIANFTYDENGLRTSKYYNANSTFYNYNGSLLMSMTYNGWATLLFSYDASGQVVSVNYNGTEYYYVRNGQGDIIKIIDGNGSTVVEYKYDTRGKIVSQTGDYNIGYLNPFRYRGYVYDEATGWYYLQSRYYDPETGRFLNADALISTGQGVLGYNMYAYCGNSPVNRADSSGECWHNLWLWNCMKCAAAKKFSGKSTVAILETMVDRMPLGHYLKAATGTDWDGSKFTSDERCEQLAQGLEASMNAVISAYLMGGTIEDVGGGGFIGDIGIPPYPGNDPAVPPGAGYEWRGRGEPGSPQGNWYKPSTGEWMRPDLNHKPPIPPHWDYGPGKGIPKIRIFPPGTKWP